MPKTKLPRSASQKSRSKTINCWETEINIARLYSGESFGTRSQKLRRFHYPRRCAHGFLNVRFAVCGGEEASLELRRGQIDAGLQHAVEKFLESLTVRFHRVGKIPNGSAGEVAAEHRTAAVEGDGHAGGFCGVAHPGFQLRAEFFERGVSRGPHP